MFKHIVAALSALIFFAAPAHADRRIEFTASQFYGPSTEPAPDTIHGAFQFLEDPTDFSSPKLTKVELTVAGHTYQMSEVYLSATRSMIWLRSVADFEPGTDSFQMFTGANGSFFQYVTASDNTPWYAGQMDIVYSNVPGAVPEPETYGMLFAGLALIGAVARRRSV